MNFVVISHLSTVLYFQVCARGPDGHRTNIVWWRSVSFRLCPTRPSVRAFNEGTSLSRRVRNSGIDAITEREGYSGQVSLMFV